MAVVHWGMGRLLLALALVATACGGTTGSGDDVTIPETTATTAVGVGEQSTSEDPASAAATSNTAATSDTAATSNTAATSDATREKPDGRPAPDFVLALGEGGEFSPSSEDKPIYMVFWAEW